MPICERRWLFRAKKVAIGGARNFFGTKANTISNKVVGNHDEAHSGGTPGHAESVPDGTHAVPI